MRDNLKVFICWSVFLSLLIMLCYYFAWHPKLNTNDPMEVLCLELQNDANCTILRQGEHVVVIDAGEQVDAEVILKSLQENHITNIDYLILTHPDQDHIGSAKAILESVSVNKVISTYYTKENKKFEEVLQLCEQKNIKVFYPSHTQKLQAGNIHLIIYPPFEKNYADANNYSLAILVQHENVNALFVGDALRKRTEELMKTNWPKIDLYMVAHHGRENRLSEKFLQQISPKIAVVTADSADSAITDTCDKIGTTILYTGHQDCFFVSDGKNLTLQQ